MIDYTAIITAWGASETLRRYYTHDIELCQRWATQRGLTLDELDSAEISEYATFLSYHYAHNTVRRMLYVLRRVYADSGRTITIEMLRPERRKRNAPFAPLSARAITQIISRVNVL